MSDNEKYSPLGAFLDSIEPTALREMNKICDQLAKENAELKAKLAKGQESFELVLDNTVSDKATINLLCDALKTAANDMKGWASYASEYFKEKHNLERDLKELRDLAKQYKQG